MELKVGEQAPDFGGINENGEEVLLSDYTGKKVILYFYPKDNTPGCTAQSCDLRDNYQLMQSMGYEVIGVSSDSEESHKKFKAKHELPFSLIADTDKSIHNLYGVWGEKNMYGRKYMGTFRTTFVIDEKGEIAEIIKKVKTKEHAKQILKN
jgi:peroxiredoxin Q/BCP